MFKPLTEEQYNKAVKAGFSPAQIIDMEKKRKAEETKTPLVAKPKKDLLQKTGDVVNAIFPGKQVGQAIGTLAGSAYTGIKDKLTGRPEQLSSYDLSAPTPLQVGGDIAQGALSIAGPKIGVGKSLLGRLGANTALGVGVGTTQALADGKTNLGDIASSGATGGAIGLGAGAIGEGIGAVINKLPTWFAKSALPKLNTNNIDYALKNAKIAPISTNLKSSNKAINQIEDGVQTVLNSPKYIAETGNLQGVASGVVEQFKNSQIDEKTVMSMLQQVAPENKSLVIKVMKGTANIAEQNTLRRELDRATYGSRLDTAKLTFVKKVAKAFSDGLRTNVKSTAQETVPMFDDYAKEINFNSALRSMSKKIEDKPIIGLYDVLAFLSLGPAGVVGERLLTSKGVQLGTAKAIQKVAPLTQLGQGLKAPITKLITED